MNRKNRYLLLTVLASSITACGGGGSSATGGSSSSPTPTPTPVACGYDSSADGTLVNSVAELEGALTAAGGNGSPDKIYLAAGTFNVSQTLFYDAKGTTESIEIIGCGSDQTIIDGGGTTRIFHFMKDGEISDWGSSNIHQPPYPTLIIRNISVRNGNDANDYNRNGKDGGGILIERYNTSIYESDFIKNRSEFTGGAVSGAANLFVKDSSFTDNYARNAGSAILACGSVRIEGSEFRRGRDGGIGTNGAAVARVICLEQDYSTLPVEVVNSTFSDNRTAISVTGGYGSEPGGLGEVVVEGSTLSESHIRALDLAHAGNLTIRGSVFSDNGPWEQANESTDCTRVEFTCDAGGAIFDRTGGGLFDISDTSFIRNFALDYGGAIFRLGSQRCVNGTEGCDPTRTPSLPFDVILADVNFEANRSHRGAAISIARENNVSFGFMNGNIYLERVSLKDNVGHRPALSVSGVPEDETETSIIVAGGNVVNCLGSQSGNTADFVILSKGTLSTTCLQN